MGIGKFFKSVFDSKVLGEETIKTQEKIFNKQKELFPNRDPHFYLAQVWLSRMDAKGLNPNDPDLQMLAFSETFLCACVPPPQCARALGLYILYKERPDIIQAYHIFDEEFNRLMQPVLEAQENGTIEQLYQKYNPRMADEISSKE